jgi:hypothetical protein
MKLVDARSQLLQSFDTLPMIMTIDNAESNLFRDSRELQIKAGCWARFLDALTQTTDFISSGAMCGVKWASYCENVTIGYIATNIIQRYLRWIEIEIANHKMVIAFVPTIYYENPRPYVDHRFIVSSTDPKIAPLALLFGDHILGQCKGDDSWEMDSTATAS